MGWQSTCDVCRSLHAPYVLSVAQNGDAPNDGRSTSYHLAVGEETLSRVMLCEGCFGAVQAVIDERATQKHKKRSRR